MHQFHFLIPDPASFMSGGNVYNAHLMTALTNAGAHVSHSPFQPELMLTSPDTVYIFDSIYFEKIERPGQQIPPRCIALIHHLNSLYPLSEEYFRQKEKSILDQFSGFIVTSQFTSYYLTDRGFDPAQIFSIEPAPTFQKQTNRLPSPQVHALILGSCIPRKGQLRFLQALAEADITRGYTLVIAGSLTADVEYAHHCADIILHHDTLKKCVRLLGEQAAGSIQQLYDQSNLYVSSSEMETFGMAIQDAVMSGMPVLALEGGYAAEHVSPGINGYRCKNVAQLVIEFRRCVMDSDHFLTLQQRAASFAPEYGTWDDGAKKLIEAFMS